MITEFDMTTGALIDTTEARGPKDYWTACHLSEPFIAPTLQLMALETERGSSEVFPADLAFESMEAFVSRQQG